MLGVAVERDAGHSVEGGLLGDVARVGDDAAGIGREPSELEIGQGVLDEELRAGDLQLGEQSDDDTQGLVAQGCNDGHVGGLTDECLQHQAQLLLVGQQGLAVEREDEVAGGGESERCRWRESR